MQGRGTTLNIKSLRSAKYDDNTPEMYASPKVAKDSKPKNLALGKIKDLKGMVDSIIVETKSETRNIRTGFDLLRSY